MTDNKNQNLVSRSPVVVILGHVDHGKSSILEAIKDLKITNKESGGITQHIGAYEIEHEGKKITFIDTPGHEAFSAMRSRGAKVADIAILVIAADDGIQPQTKEAITHIKKAGIPFIIAFNKVDKAEANPAKIKRELLSHDVTVEDMGGKIPSVLLSAKTKEGIPHLLEIILLLADLENLLADTANPAQGVVIEAYLDNFRGPTATVLVESGFLRKGDVIGTPSAYGKIKAIENFQKNPLEEVSPSMPALVLGFEMVPGVGESFQIFPDLESAKAQIKAPQKFVPPPVPDEEHKATLNIILKVDFVGSAEAMTEVLKSLPQDKVGLRIIKADVGDINEGDIKMAFDTRATILGFRVKVDPVAKKLASREKVRVLTFDIIYELAQAVRQGMERILTPDTVKTEVGFLKILAVFKVDKSRQVVGGKMQDGVIQRGQKVDVQRGKKIVGQGKIVGLQKNKKEVSEVTKGSECGILYEGTAVLEEGDIIIGYKEQQVKGSL